MTRSAIIILFEALRAARRTRLEISSDQQICSRGNFRILRLGEDIRARESHGFYNSGADENSSRTFVANRPSRSKHRAQISAPEVF